MNNKNKEVIQNKAFDPFRLRTNFATEILNEFRIDLAIISGGGPSLTDSSNQFQPQVQRRVCPFKRYVNPGMLPYRKNPLKSESNLRTYFNATSNE